MKVLFYLRHLGHGGGQRATKNISEALAKKGYDVTFVVSYTGNHEYELNKNIKKINYEKNKYKKILDADGYKIRKLFLLLPMALKLRKTIKTEKPDIVIAFGFSSIRISILASLFLKVPVLISERSNPAMKPLNIYQKISFKFIYPLCDGIVFQTKEMKDYFQEKLKRKSTIINNLVDERFFNIIKTSETKNIIGVGYLNSNKNWKNAIKAFSLIADKIHDNFIIYGYGEDYENLNNYINELGLSNRVILAGGSDEIEKKVANTKLFVFSSNSEGSPNALIEALIMGIPCVSTRFSGGGADELIESGVNGIIVPKNDPEAMAGAMLNVLTNPEYAEQLSKNAAQRARKEFDPEQVFMQWEEFMLLVIERHKNTKKIKTRNKN